MINDENVHSNQFNAKPAGGKAKATAAAKGKSIEET